MSFLLSALWACAPQPASLAVEGESTVTVHELGTVPLPTVTVLDADGKAIEPAPQGLVFSVSPAEVAAIEDDHLVTKADGTATVTAKLGALMTSSTVEVSLPDTVRIQGVPDALPAVGGTFQVTADVLADGDVLDGRPVTFSSSDPAVLTVDDHGAVTLVAPGTATLTATSGDLKAELPIVVAAAAPADGTAAPGQL